MKKALTLGGISPLLLKFDLKMKLSILFLIISLFQLQANESYAQKTKISLNLQNVRLEQVLDEIESLSEFKFIYKDSEVDYQKIVSVKARKKHIYSILDEIFSGSNTVFKVVDKHIILSRKQVSSDFGKQTAQSSQISQIQISGLVTDQKNLPLPGVNVVIKGTRTGTTTDFDGNYTISASADQTLVFSYIGYASKEVVVGSSNTINVIMVEEASALDQVVVVGYGSVKKSNLTYSVSKVEGDNLSNRPIGRLDAALQGQLAGVTIRQPNGAPGQAPSFTVRGVNSISAGSGPLYVIDGLPVSDPNIIGNLNMAAVESIEVLKDAAAAAIYGSRGAGGVVIVTTKKGEKGKVNIGYNSYVGFQEAEKIIDMLSGPEQRAMIREAYEDVNGAGTFVDWDLPANENYNHLDDFFKTGNVQGHSVTLSGGNEKSLFFGGIDYFNQDGIVDGTGFERLSSRMNASFQLSEKIEIGTSLEFGYSNKQESQVHGKGNALNHVLAHAAFVPLDLYRVKTYDPLRAAPYENPLYGLSVEGSRSLDRTQLIDDHRKRGQFLSNTYVKINLAEGLNFKTSFGLVNISEDRRKFNPGNRWDPTQVDRYTLTSLNWLSETTLDYTKDFGDHNLSLLVGYTSQKESAEASTITGRSFPNDLVPTLNAAADFSNITNNINEWGLVSYLARAIYSYGDRYLLTASLRRDGSSRFGTDNKWGTFSALSAGWNISNEEFFNSKAINKLKLRASWGQTGNDQIGNYDQYGLLRSVTAVFDGQSVGGFSINQNQVENPELRWEKNNSFDIGVDLGLFKNRIQFSVDYYNNTTSDLLLNVPFPTITGFTQGRQNVGEVVNKGWDFEISTQNFRKGDFKWSTSFVLNINDNKVTKMNAPDAVILDGFRFQAANNNITKVGEAIGSFYLYVADGIYNDQTELDAHNVVYTGQTPRVGELKIKDINGDGIIDENDQTVVGQPIAKYNFGLTNTFNYKNFDLNVLISGAGGNKIYNAAGREPGNANALGRRQNKYGYFRDRWTPTNTDAKYPRVSGGAFAFSDGNARRTTLNLFDGDFWRVKNLTLGYNIDGGIFGNVFNNARIYLSGENLFLSDKYDVGFNPEAFDSNSATTATRGAGVDYASFPNATTYSIGVNVNF